MISRMILNIKRNKSLNYCFIYEILYQTYTEVKISISKNFVLFLDQLDISFTLKIFASASYIFCWANKFTKVVKKYGPISILGHHLFETKSLDWMKCLNTRKSKNKITSQYLAYFIPVNYLTS